MYPLFFTTAFLMMMALFSASEMSHYQLSSLQSKMYKNYLLTCHATQEERVYTRFEKEENEVKKKGTGSGDNSKEDNENKEPCARSLDFSKARPPNNGKLNFYNLLHESTETGTFSLYETGARLLKELYGKEPIFQKIERAEYRILNALIAVKEKSKGFSYPDELASLELEDEELKELFQLMIRGGTISQPMVCLLDHITFDKEGTRFDRKINFLFASEPLLHALLNNPPLVALLIEERTELWELIENQERKRTELLQKNAMGRREVQNRVKQLVEGALQKYNVDSKGLFDYTLGKKGTIFYAEDPLTKSITRQKL